MMGSGGMTSVGLYMAPKGTEAPRVFSYFAIGATLVLNRPDPFPVPSRSTT